MAEVRRSRSGGADELSSLPSQPFAALEILRIVNNENTSAQQIGRIIDADPALAARVLRMANSPYYGLPRGIASPSQAVVLLGLTTVKALAVGAACGLLAEGRSSGPVGLWTHAVTRAVAASTIAGEIGASQSEAFTAGLLANIGVSLLFQADPQSYAEVLALVESDEIPLEVAEQRLLGSTHVEAGARALDSWRFPSSFVRAVLMHHMPIDTVSDRLARIVIAAGAFARFVDSAFPQESTDVPSDVVEALGIGAGRIQRIADMITAKVDELAPTLGISPDRKREGSNLERDADQQLAAVRGNAELTRTAQQLVLSSCLLEVTKLAGAGVPLASFVRQALDVVTQFLPVVACSLELRPEELPRLVSTVGIFDEREVVEFPVEIDGKPVGLLRVLPDASTFADNDLFVALTDSLSSVIAEAIEGERERRNVSVGEAERLAGALPDADLESHINRLVNVLATLPQVSGAHLELDEPVLALQLGSTEGLTAGGVQRVELSLDPGSLAIETYWPTGAPVAGSADSLALVAVANVLRDSVLRLRQEHELSAGALVDDVTGLANRRSIERTLRSALNRMDVMRDSVSVVAVEVDEFRDLVGVVGVERANNVLRAVAGGIEALIEPGCTPVRDGEASMLVVAPAWSTERAREFAMELAKRAPDWCVEAIEGWAGPLTLSVGIATYPVDAGSHDSLVRASEDNLVRARLSGGNRIVTRN